jgi:2-haloacid dehalogenase
VCSNGVKALTFDVFGTVVDYRTTLIREGKQINQAKGLTVAWGRLADDWRDGYRPILQRVEGGELPWLKLDVLHRMLLDDLIPRFGLDTLSEAERADLNRVWHRLQPWPDAVSGLERLRRRYILAPLSNGNLALLTNMAKHAGLPWDCVLSADLARAYKPNPQVYRMAADLLDLRPDDIMMVAAHQGDLHAA